MRYSGTPPKHALISPIPSVKYLYRVEKKGGIRKVDISLLLVDDDTLLLDHLRSDIDWEKIGISMVFTAGSVEQAKKILLDYHIRILISDVEMPQGSGLDLIAWVRQEQLPVRCILLSSYAYFSYAQQAIRLKTSEYLLKPISNEDLEETVTRYVTEIRKEEKEPEGAPAQRGGLDWRDVCQEGISIDREKITVGGREVSQSDRFDLYLIEIGRRNDGEKAPDHALTHYVLKESSAEYMQRFGLVPEAVLPLTDIRWVMIFQDCGRADTLHAAAGELAAFLKERLGEEVSIAIGRPRSLGGIADEKERLITLMETAVQDESGILSMEIWKQLPERRMEPPWKDWEQKLSEGREEELAGVICTWLRSFCRRGRLTKTMLHGFGQDLLSFVKNRMQIPKEQMDLRDLEDSFEKADTLPEMEACITSLLERVKGIRRQNAGSGETVAYLCSYIRDHLDGDLSRKILAEQVYLSEDYVSRIFIRETGSSLSAYIMNARMEKAGKLLASTSMSVSAVAMQVGYHNFSYFSKNFRDATGFTPNEYRKNNKKADQNNRNAN